MTEHEIYDHLKQTFCDVFDEECIVLGPATTAADVEGWDSLGHIRLVIAIEERLKIKFNAFEINAWPNVGALVLSIQKKLT
jgi:acyl carrier protein